MAIPLAHLSRPIWESVLDPMRELCRNGAPVRINVLAGRMGAHWLTIRERLLTAEKHGCVRQSGRGGFVLTRKGS
jgi:Mn-dependent DtxR family transcriptional regulator